MVIKRDKLFAEYNTTDFVKYFMKKFREVNNNIEYQIVFARDCTIMLGILRRFNQQGKPIRGIFKFIDDMFVEYPKRKRVKPIDIQFLLGVVDLYLSKKNPKRKAENKVKTPAVELDDEMKAWLKAQKEKYFKEQRDSAV